MCPSTRIRTHNADMLYVGNIKPETGGLLKPHNSVKAWAFWSDWKHLFLYS